MYDTGITGFTLRFATEKDTALIMAFVRELAVYENLLSKVKATESSLAEAIFSRKIAEVVIGEYQGNPVGFALYFYSLSTFIGQPGIYLEDLFVKPEYRSRGFGKTLLAFLSKLAKERNCWGLEWSVLDWNEPSLNFYRSLGAKERSDWRIYRLCDEALEKLAGSFIEFKD